MTRLKRPVFMFFVGQLSIIALVWVLVNGSPIRAQDPTPTNSSSPITGRYEVFPSKPDGTSDTIGQLPPTMPGYHYLSFTTAGFVPVNSAQSYLNYGKGIINNDGTFQSYIRPIDDLPQGSLIQGLVLIGGDVEPDTAGNRDTKIALSLIRSEIDRLDLATQPFSEQEIIFVLSDPNTPLLSDLGIYTNTTALQEPIDHTQYAYFLKVDIPTGNLLFRGGRIDYLPPGRSNLPYVSQ